MWRHVIQFGKQEPTGWRSLPPSFSGQNIEATVPCENFNPWVSNQRPANFYYATRDHICTVCLYVFKSQTVIYAFRYTPGYYLSNCDPRTSPENSVWPLEIKSFEAYFSIHMLKYIKTRDVAQVVTFLTYTWELIFSNFNRDTNDVD